MTQLYNSISWINLIKLCKFTSSPRRFSIVAGNFHLFIELAKCTKLRRMCCTARMLWQCGHSGIICEFLNTNLWVRWLCPILNLFKTLISLLLVDWREGHRLIFGLIYLNFWINFEIYCKHIFWNKILYPKWNRFIHRPRKFWLN